jgi:3-deoxy-manno-octulosonate cytidylyltransferase (CMP-KDO synthetase)
MKNTAIIIPSRLAAKRFPNKPLAKINNIPMIVYVLRAAEKSKIGEVFVATPDEEIFQVVKKNGGKAILTKYDHTSGTERIYEAYLKQLKDKVDLIINLQGDNPLMSPNSIIKLEKLMRENKCDIGTLASKIKDEDEVLDSNIVKVEVNDVLTKNNFLGAKDFFRRKKDLKNENIYHHCGVYIFTKDALTRYVSLSRSKLEIDRNLEQMRAMENNMVIKVGLIEDVPLSVDTEEDLKKISKQVGKQ